MHLAEKEFPTPIPILKPKQASCQAFVPWAPAVKPCMEHLCDYAAPTCSRIRDAQSCHYVPLRPLPALVFADEAAQQVNVEHSASPSFLGQCPSASIRKIAGVRRQIVIAGRDASPPSSPPDVCRLELNTGPEQVFAWKSLHDIHSEELGGFSKWQRPEPEKVAERYRVGMPSGQDCCLNREDHEECEGIPSVKGRKRDASDVLEMSSIGGHVEGIEDSNRGHMAGLDCLHGIFKLSGLIVAANVQEKSLVEFLCAKKQHKDHFLDEIVVNADVYHSHPWHYTGGDTKAIYFCCITKYAKRGNMTRDRMTREGGRWKQQGIVQPILTAKSYGPATKTYLSYIPRGKLSNAKGYFIHTNPGRVKHRHRMIEIALEEDLKSEKRSLKHKVTPKPFLVVCVLRKP